MGLLGLKFFEWPYCTQVIKHGKEERKKILDEFPVCFSSLPISSCFCFCAASLLP